MQDTGFGFGRLRINGSRVSSFDVFWLVAAAVLHRKSGLTIGPQNGQFQCQ